MRNRRKRLAVLKAYVMWAWIEQQKDYNTVTDDINIKSLYPIKELVSSRNFYHCSLCKYTNNVCDYCPMLNRWPSEVYPDRVELIVRECASDLSAYSAWENDNLTNKWNTIYAGDIANALWKLYKELEVTK